MSKLASHCQYQRGIADTKKLGIFAIGGFVLFMVVIIATAPAPKAPETTTGQNAQASGQSPAPQPSPAPAEGQEKASPAVVKLAEDFRRFTSKQYNFSLAYPESWGSPITQPAQGGFILRANTKDVSYPLSTAILSGAFAINVYRPELFRVEVRPGNPTVQPSKQDGKITWKITTVGPDEPTYRVGNAYKVESRTNPSGLTIHDFTWVNAAGQRQARWAFEAKDTYILMSLPPVTAADGTASPTGSELSFYTAFANQVIDTVTISQ